VREAPCLSQIVLYFGIFIMSFFDSVRTQSYDEPVVIYVNEESVSLSEAQYRGKSVSQLVAEYASGLVDVSRVNRYVINGTAVSGDTVVRPGETIRVSISCESKGSY
jgi:hypothetical protein